jgi:hypothetical protein
MANTHITTHGKGDIVFDRLIFCSLGKAQCLLDFRLCAGLDWYYVTQHQRI